MPVFVEFDESGVAFRIDGMDHQRCVEVITEAMVSDRLISLTMATSDEEREVRVLRGGMIRQVTFTEAARVRGRELSVVDVGTD